MTKDRQIRRPWSKTSSGRRLAALRKLRSMTQPELAHTARVDTQKIANAEHGFILLDEETMDGVGHALRVVPSSLKVMDLVGSGATASFAPNVGIRCLYLIAKSLGLRPVSNDDCVGLVGDCDLAADLLEALAEEQGRISHALAETKGDPRSAVEISSMHLFWRCDERSEVSGLAHAFESREVYRQASYGQALKAARTHRRMTQTELAEASGTNARAIRNYEGDKWLPKESMAIEIAKALHVRFEAMLPLGIASQAQAVETLLDVASAFHLTATVSDVAPMLATQSRDIEKALESLAQAWERGQQAQEVWYATYDDAHARWPRRSRYGTRLTWEGADGDRHVNYVSDDVDVLMLQASSV